MVEKRDFVFHVLIFSDDVAYSVKTENVEAFGKIKKLMNEKHIPIDDELEVMNEDGYPLNQFIGIRNKRDVKKLINVLINEPWCFLHIGLD